ncbi:hypothetical protein HK105_206657 [Polyrhizophydium stewartii]|uniref:THUMP domain-containing protein n=1 Tax=Polyrhizophydium stewartii TaxID=2732419 RepID=A0ABR4N2J3_9FUNG
MKRSAHGRPAAAKRHRPSAASAAAPAATAAPAAAGTIPIRRGRFKARYLRKHAALLHRPRDDPARGLLVSTSVHAETRALGQIRALLDDLMVSLFPDHRTVWGPRPETLDIDLSVVADPSGVPAAPNVRGSDSDSDSDDQNDDQSDGDGHGDGEAEPAGDGEADASDAQVQPPKQRDRRFQAVDAACGGLLFMRFRVSVSPSEFIDKLVGATQRLQPNPGRCGGTPLTLIRLLPIDLVCAADIPSITAAAREVLDAHTEHLAARDTIAIVTEIRNCVGVSRDAIIAAVAPLLPSRMSVNLKSPSVVLMVSVFKSCCGIGLIDDYYQNKKLNVHAL